MPPRARPRSPAPGAAGLAPGVYRFSLTASDGTRASGALALPYPAEDTPATPAGSTLGDLVAQTGGAVLAPGDLGALAVHEHSLRAAAALLALVVFLVGVAGRMWMWRRPRRPPRDGAAREHRDARRVAGARR